MRHPAPTSWLLVWTALALLASPAIALADDPVLKEREGASRLRPGEEAAPLQVPVPLALEVAEEAEEEEAIGGYTVGAHLRFVGLPDLILGEFFSEMTSYMDVSVGASIEIGHPRDGQWVIELDWTRIHLADANWRRNGDDPGGAVFVQTDLHMISADVTYRGHVFINEWLSWFGGAGIGIAGLAGDIHTAEVLPTCTEPVDECRHWNKATHTDVDLPTRVLPVIHLTTGLSIIVDDSFTARLEIGIRNVPYVGLMAGFRL